VSEEISQPTVDDIPVVKSDTKNEDPKSCEKITANKTHICVKNPLTFYPE
jgi:hypothetical protein